MALCTYSNCDEDRAPNRRRCHYHLAMWRSDAAKKRAYYDAKGRCVRCGSDSRVTETMCQRCVDQKKTYNTLQLARYKTSGLCARCGHPRDRLDRSRCAGCREYARNVEKRRVKHADQR